MSSVVGASSVLEWESVMTIFVVERDVHHVRAASKLEKHGPRVVMGAGVALRQMSECGSLVKPTYTRYCTDAGIAGVFVSPVCVRMCVYVPGARAETAPCTVLYSTTVPYAFAGLRRVLRDARQMPLNWDDEAGESMQLSLMCGLR